jgi:hypothetical protein
MQSSQGQTQYSRSGRQLASKAHPRGGRTAERGLQHQPIPARSRKRHQLTGRVSQEEEAHSLPRFQTHPLPQGLPRRQLSHQTAG